MRRVGLFLLAAAAVCAFAWVRPGAAAAITLYSETFGATAALPAGWTSSNTTNGWSGSTASVSTGYAGASGGANVLFNNTGAGTGPHTLTYSNNLSTVGYSDITVLWAARATATFNGTVGFQWSPDGVNWNTVSYADVSKNATWTLVNSGVRIALPAGAAGQPNLRLRFVGTPPASSVSGNYRVDDFSVQATAVEQQPSVSVGDVSVPEPASGQTYAQFPFTLSASSSQTVTVSFSTANGTATSPGDYTSLSGTVTFAPGETQKTVAVAVKADAVSESDETFNLNLSSPSNATVADGTGVATITPPVAAGTILINEFRLRGPGGSDDEFVELYNNTDADITVTDSNLAGCTAQVITLGLPIEKACGWALVDLQGSVSNVPRFVVPTGTVIPARGHFLAVGSTYSLSAVAASDLMYTTPDYGDADFTGLALYKTADRAQFTQANVFDSVGFDGVATPFREGNGLLPQDGVLADAEHCFVRNQGSGRPADTGDNRADFSLVATNPVLIANGTATLGAPGPENSTGLVSRNSGFTVGVPTGVASSLRTTSPAVTNGDLGTLSLRRRFTNNTGQTLTKLRFRVTEVPTLNSRLVYGSQAEMRVLDAQLTGLSGLKATTVEATPSHPSGGGVNTGLVVNGSLTLSQPLQNGQSVDVEFLLGVMKGGTYQFILVVEGAP